MGQQGIYIESYYLATEQNGVNYLLRDEAELREHFPNINSVLAVEQVWDVSVIEQDMPITLWCYSETVIDTFSPSMKSGRWFQDADMNSDILKAVVMQDYALVDDFTAIENVLLPLDFAKSKAANRKKLAEEALEAVGMLEYKSKPVKKLSGGQKQRIAIARAIVNHPSVLLADEPTGALDSNTSTEIMELLKRLNKQGMTIVIITHDMGVAALCDRKIEIADGSIVSATEGM